MSAANVILSEQDLADIQTALGHIEVVGARYPQHLAYNPGR
jgi:hypothetical protein